MKQSSIEWLVEQYQYKFGTSITKVMEEEIQQAKQMHKQEIVEAHCDWKRIIDKLPSRSANEYYKNTYEKTR